MHRLILGLKFEDGKIVDHINGDTLDNRKANLRIVTPRQNAANMRMPSDNTSGHKGVTFQQNIGMWAAQIKSDGKNYLLGYYVDIEDAIEARRVKEIELFGEYSRQYGKASEIDSPVISAYDDKCKTDRK